MLAMPSITPWANIGGCGAGGSGGGSGDGIKWVGFGVSGGLIDAEIMPKYNFGQNFQTLSIAPRLSFKPTYTTTIGISIPFTSKSGEVQPKTNFEPSNRTTGGLGDISVDISKAVGMSGEYSIDLSLALPTGQYDIQRGSDAATFILPTSLQKGGGIYSASLDVSRSMDVEDGIWLFNVTLGYPFNIKFNGRNEMLDTRYEDYANLKNNRRFYYYFKPYGENDLGDYTPPSVSGGVNYGYKGVAGYVHSWGATFGVPLGVAWIHSPYTTIYAPSPDPDFKAWSAALVYGLEFSRQKFPVFMAVSLPIHDKSSPDSPGQWDGPDWKDFGNQWTLALGIKTTMF